VIDFENQIELEILEKELENLNNEQEKKAQSEVIWNGNGVENLYRS